MKKEVHLHHSIQVLNLSTRSHNALRRNDLHTIGHLVEYLKTEELYYIRNLGMVSSREIHAALRRVKIVKAIEV